MAKKFHLLLPGFSIFCSLLLAGCGAGVAESPPAPERVQAVEVSPVSQRDLTETLVVVGSLAANESADVRAEISGLVRQIRFQEGQQVEEGEVLVELDDRDLQAQLREATVRLELAKQTFERNEKLLSTQSVSLADRDRALAELESARATRDLLQVRLDKCIIRAPFAGTIGARNISPGDLVNPSDSISRLDDLSRLKVEFALPERHADRVEPNSRVLLHAGKGQSRTTVPGIVYFVSPAIDRATRAIQVKAILESPPPFLRPGMFAQVEVILEEKEKVLTVPETAILAREGSYFLVLVERDQEDREVIGYSPVRLGLRQNGLVEVIPLGGEGLTAGQEVVAAGVGSLPLFPGARVETRPMKEPGTSASNGAGDEAARS